MDKNHVKELSKDLQTVTEFFAAAKNSKRLILNELKNPSPYCTIKNKDAFRLDLASILSLCGQFSTTFAPFIDDLLSKIETVQILPPGGNRGPQSTQLEPLFVWLLYKDLSQRKSGLKVKFHQKTLILILCYLEQISDH